MSSLKILCGVRHRFLSVVSLFVLLLATAGFGQQERQVSSISNHEIGAIGEGESASLDRALESFAGRFEGLANEDPEVLAAILRQTYGDRLGEATVHDWIAKARDGTFSRPEHFQFVAPEVLDWASAAYHAGDGGLVLINADLIDADALLADLMAEELGHHFDSLLGPGDAAGDEGEIFRLGLRGGQPIPALNFRLLIAQDDHALIEFEGSVIEVELFLKKFRRAVSKTAKSVGKAIKTQAVKIAVQAPKTGKAIGNAWKNAGIKVAESSVSAGKNLGGAIADTGRGLSLGVQSAGAALAGDVEKSNHLNDRANSRFDRAGTRAKRGALNVVDVLAAPGDAYNQTTAALDTLIPGLGFAFDVALGSTVFGPYVGAASAFSDVSNASRRGDWQTALIAGSFAVVDVGGGKLGDKFEQLGEARNLRLERVRGAKYIENARATGQMVDPMLNASRATRFRNAVVNFSPDYAYWGDATGTAISRSRHFGIPGRDRDDNAELLGTGGTDFQSYSKSYGVDLGAYGGPPPLSLLPARRLPTFGVPSGQKQQTTSVIQGRQLGPGGNFFEPFVQGPPPIPVVVSTPTVSNTQRMPQVAAPVSTPAPTTAAAPTPTPVAPPVMAPAPTPTPTPPSGG